ncbi:hypothetical protein JCM1841_004139 [Sporobolomyces salmonicolor]
MAASPSIGNYYQLLSLSPGASSDEIRTAYLCLAKVFHPDRAPEGHKDQATAVFHRVAAAYTVLSDPEQRKAYDASLFPPPPARAPSSAQATCAPSSSSLVPARPSSPSPLARVYSPSPFPGPVRPPSPSQSPFPGYRVPPGGYPSTQNVRFPSFEYYSPPPPHAYSLPPPRPSIDPFVLFERVLATRRRMNDGPGAGMGLGMEGMEKMLWGEGGGTRRAGSAGGGSGTRRMSASWNEGERHRNGDWKMMSAMQDHEEAEDGSIRFSSTIVQVSYSSGLPPHHNSSAYRPASPSHNHPPLPPVHHRPSYQTHARPHTIDNTPSRSHFAPPANQPSSALPLPPLDLPTAQLEYPPPTSRHQHPTWRSSSLSLACPPPLQIQALTGGEQGQRLLLDNTPSVSRPHPPAPCRRPPPSPEQRQIAAPSPSSPDSTLFGGGGDPSQASIRPARRLSFIPAAAAAAPTGRAVPSGGRPGVPHQPMGSAIVRRPSLSAVGAGGGARTRRASVGALVR